MELSTNPRRISRKSESLKKSNISWYGVSVLFVVWKTFHKNSLDVYYSSAFIDIYIYTYTNIYI